jgi:WD40 repeat protein
MIYGKDADNSWLITGSIDRVVKLWSLDGNLIQRFDGFSDTISSLCYVPPTQTLWVTANSSTPIVYDPRSGINVSDFVQTDDERFHPPGGSFGFKLMNYIPETSEVIAVTTRRSLVFWKYNSMAPLTVLPGHTDIVECLTFNPKEPILIFSGGDDGIIRKWERLQLNTFMYSQEVLLLPKEEVPEVSKKDISTVHKDKKLKSKKYYETPNVLKQVEERERLSSKALNVKQRKPGVVSLAYYEELDLLISGYEDHKIRVWGYNQEEVDTPELAVNDEYNTGVPNENATNRVAGMSLKAVLSEHKDAVVGLSSFKRDGKHWLLSTGWDRRIFLWDLLQLKVQDVFKNGDNVFGKEELAADGLILGIEYSPDRNEFGYCSADKSAYIRKFSPNGNEMKLVAVLQGHEAEVTTIKWHSQLNQWFTGSEDRTIRVWPAEGIPCIRVINNDGPVTALCIDVINGCIISGSQDKVIRVFDTSKKDEIVQKNVGHTDEIRSILHVPSRNQYISASWDNSVRVWNAYFKKGQRKIAKAQVKYNMEEDENIVSFSDANPLIVPKLLLKPVFVKEFVLEKAPQKDDDNDSNVAILNVGGKNGSRR